MSEVTRPIVSVIIVNWNSLTYLDKCLEILYNSEGKTPFEVIVIDNASYDGSGDLVKKYPLLRFYQLKQNIGFSGANNYGSKQALGEVLIFLNPDTEPSNGTIDILSGLVLSNDNIGAAGCLLLNSDRSFQSSSLMPFPTLINEILDNEFIINRLGSLRSSKTKYIFSKEIFEKVSVDAISGACIAVKKNVFEAVNGFNEDYFMYSEDIDLCYKIKKIGKINVFTNKCNVIHHGGGSSKLHPKTAFSRRMILESKRKYFKNNHSTFYSILFCITMVVVSIIRIIIISLSIPLLLNNVKRIKLMYHKWIVSFIWAVTSIF